MLYEADAVETIQPRGAAATSRPARRAGRLAPGWQDHHVADPADGLGPGKLIPDRAVANEEAIALRAWAATPHAVDLLDADLEAGALLLEKIEPGTKASDEPQGPPADEAAELLTGLRETAKYDSGQLPTMAQGMESMFSRIGELLSNPRVSPVVASHRSWTTGTGKPAS
jgi:hypothetical protein